MTAAPPAHVERQSMNAILVARPGRILRWVIVGIAALSLLSDLVFDKPGFSHPGGWFELLLPYFPLGALFVSTLLGLVALAAVLVTILALNAPGLLFAAITLSALTTFIVAALTLPVKVTALLTPPVIMLIPLSYVVNPAIGGAGTVRLTFAAFLGTAAASTIHWLRSKAMRQDRELQRTREEHALIQQRERTRLAYELHDIVAHDITIIAMQAQRAELIAETEKLHEIFRSVADSAKQTLEDLRSLVLLLRTFQGPQEDSHPPRPGEASAADRLKSAKQSGETTTAAGLIYDLHDITGALRASGFSVNLRVEGEAARIPASTRQSLRRIARELGTNILKHGSPARGADLQLLIEPKRITLSSANSISPERAISSSHTGLEAIRARCEIMGGTVRASSDEGRWTTTVTIPLNLSTR